MDQLLPSTYYHIYNHANSDEDLFREPENYRYFLQQYHKHIDKIGDTYAYCQMPNHFHLLVRIKAKETINAYLPGFQNLAGVEASNFLSKQFSNFFNSYTKAFNNKYDRKGSLFLKPFKKKAISSYHTLHLERLNFIELLFTSQEKYLQAHEDKVKSYDDYDKLEGYFLA